jgi:type I restriction enzyme R subunit
MKLDIQDLVAVKEVIEFGRDHERMTSSVYRERVEARVRALVAENPVLQKIQAGKSITAAELRRLAAVLARENPEITEEHLRRAYDHRTAHFIQFIRHILGLERNTRMVRSFGSPHRHPNPCSPCTPWFSPFTGRGKTHLQ